MRSVFDYLVYAYFILFPLGLLVRIKLTDNIFITPQDIVVGLIFLLLLLNLKKVKDLLFENKFILLQFGFLVVGLFSLLLNQIYYSDINMITSFLYIVRYMAVLSLLLVGSMISEKLKIKKAIFYSGVAFLVLGFIQYIFFYDLRPLTYLGWDDHLYRLFSTFFDPNFAGLFFSIFLVYLLYDSIRLQTPLAYPAIVTALFSGIAVFASYSRSALLSLFIGFVFLLTVMKKYRLIFIVFVAILGFILLFSDNNIEGANLFRSVSTNNRIENISQSLTIFQKSPYIGVGFNAFRDAQIRFGTRDEAGALQSNADAGTDNSFLLAFATTGLIGGLLFALSYIVLLKKLLKVGFFGVVISAMLIQVIIASFFINSLFYIPIMSWLFLIIGFRGRLSKVDS